MFELIIDEQPIKLRWGTKAMKLLCDRMNTNIDGFFELLNKMDKGQTTSQEVFEIVENFVMAGYEYANGTKIDEETVLEWIDKCGGVFQLNKGQFLAYMNYVISTTFNGVTPLNGEINEKKKEQEAEVGTTVS